MLANGAEAGCDPFAITPILEHAAPELLAHPVAVNSQNFRNTSHAYSRVGETLLFDADLVTECRYVDVQWSLSDGHSLRGKSASHVYAYPGDYNVVATATCDPSCGEIRRQLKVTVLDARIVDESGKDVGAELEIAADVCAETKSLRLVVEPAEYADEFTLTGKGYANVQSITRVPEGLEFSVMATADTPGEGKIGAVDEVFVFRRCRYHNSIPCGLRHHNPEERYGHSDV